MEQRGMKTGEKQRIINLLLSRDRLAHTLAANFTHEDMLVTLTYQVGPRPRSRELARQQIRQWLNSISVHRRAQGMKTKYIYLLGLEKDDGLSHRIVLNRGQETADALDNLWTYGRVQVDPLDLSQQGQTLAAKLLCQPISAGRPPVPCARLWVPSSGLKR